MNLPELLGTAGARSAPKSADGANGSMDGENGDAFMASVISAGSSPEHGASGDARKVRDPEASHGNGAGPADSKHQDAYGVIGTEAATELPAVNAPQAHSVETAGRAESPRLSGAFDPESLTLRTETRKVPAVRPESAASTAAGKVVGGAENAVSTGPEMPELAAGHSGKAPGIQTGNNDRPAHPGAIAVTVRNPASVNASGPPGTGQPSVAKGVPIEIAGTPDHPSIRQTPIPAAHDPATRGTVAKLSGDDPQSPKVEFAARSENAAAEKQLDHRREARESAIRALSREDIGGRAAAFRTAPAQVPAQSVLSHLDGIVGGGAAGQTVSGARIAVSRDALPEVRIAQATHASASDTSGKSVVQQISAALKHQPLLQKIDLSLDPPELGRIEIQMEVAESGMRATLAAERAATSELIRRQAELLIQQLDDAGFDDVSLDFRDFGSGDGERPSQQAEPELSGSAIVQDPAADSPVPAHRRSLHDTGMDIRL